MTFKKSVLQCTSIALLMALICGLVFSCPVFAVDSFSGQPFTSSNINEPDSSHVFYPLNDDISFTILLANGSITDFYVYYRNNSLVYCFLDNSLTGRFYTYYANSSGSVVSSSNTSLSNLQYSSEYNLYFIPVSTDYTNLYLPSFSSDSEGLSAVREYIDNGGSSSGDLITASSYFGVPAGYAAYIEIPSTSTDWNIEVTTEFDDYSSLFFGNWDPKTALWGFQSSLPSGSGTFSKSGLLVIPFYKAKPYTVLGQSKTGYTNKATMVANGFWSDTPSAKYLVIYNPVIRAVSGTVGGASIADNVYVYNKGISVTMSGYYSPVKYYKLESTVTTSGLESSPADGTFEDSEYTETFDSEGNSQGIVNSSGDSSTLSDGGGDLIPSATSIGDYVRNLNQTLNNFASNFIDLMTSPISHVQQLINAGTNYFNVIQGLYGWLPDEVHAVVKSGMVVALSIGVISVLL